MNDDDVVDLFVADFFAALTDRIRDVAGLLVENRTEACVTVLFTLETSGAMVGADELARAAAALRRAVSGGDGPRIGQLYASLVAAGRCEAETLDR